MIPMAEAVWRQNVAVTSEISPCSSATSLSQKSSFQAFPWRQKLFRNGHCTLTPAISSLQPKSSQVVPGHPKSSQVIPSHPKSFHVIPNPPSMSQRFSSTWIKATERHVKRGARISDKCCKKTPHDSSGLEPQASRSFHNACLHAKQSKRTSVRWRARFYRLQSGTARQKRKNWQLRSFAPNWQLGSECRCYVVRAAQMNGGKLKAEQSCTARILGFKAIQTFAIIQEIIQRSPASKTVENGQTLLLRVVCQIFPGGTSARIFKSLARFNESWLQLEVYMIRASVNTWSWKGTRKVGTEIIVEQNTHLAKHSGIFTKCSIKNGIERSAVIGLGGSDMGYQFVKCKLFWNPVLPINWSNLAMWISQIKFHKLSLAFTRKLSRTDLQNKVKATSKPHRNPVNYKSIGVCDSSTNHPSPALQWHYTSLLASVRVRTKCQNKSNTNKYPKNTVPK